MQLYVEQPFDLASSLESGQAHRWHRHGQWYSGVIFGNLVHIRQDLLGIEFRCTPAAEAELAPVLHSYFRLDDDLEAIYREITHDPRVAQMVDQYLGKSSEFTRDNTNCAFLSLARLCMYSLVMSAGGIWPTMSR